MRTVKRVRFFFFFFFSFDFTSLNGFFSLAAVELRQRALAHSGVRGLPCLRRCVSPPRSGKGRERCWRAGRLLDVLLSLYMHKQVGTWGRGRLCAASRVLPRLALVVVGVSVSVAGAVRKSGEALRGASKWMRECAMCGTSQWVCCRLLCSLLLLSLFFFPFFLPVSSPGASCVLLCFPQFLLLPLCLFLPTCWPATECAVCAQQWSCANVV
ncbi:unnamed protein product [Trypanosoma congolense IL3000]|uniref:WGS project CAEQ00000000 data, annotated contig 554 n=1 Tax=Trypanosoma congolense (strain IL3000) TaxID=1068625 RepID=F9WGV0_TRYCI|nr:unnamed protein product [Trypanosoma congolense IL3000]